ncbi:hypothetical protein [Acidovorax sp. SD340]|nr:hypothetical protein [Acidovorax sp. SD340]
MTTNPISLSKSVIAILDARKDALQWEKFIICRGQVFSDIPIGEVRSS